MLYASRAHARFSRGGRTGEDADLTRKNTTPSLPLTPGLGRFSRSGHGWKAAALSLAAPLATLRGPLSHAAHPLPSKDGGRMYRYARGGAAPRRSGSAAPGGAADDAEPRLRPAFPRPLHCGRRLGHVRGTQRPPALMYRYLSPMRRAVDGGHVVKGKRRRGHRSRLFVILRQRTPSSPCRRRPKSVSSSPARDEEHGHDSRAYYGRTAVVNAGMHASCSWVALGCRRTPTTLPHDDLSPLSHEAGVPGLMRRGDRPVGRRRRADGRRSRRPHGHASDSQDRPNWATA
ncbi:hypothetical protein CDD83_23 [Cordyceps sp. RAO-2017]|nr:hypothetical protein CDD83_23 [Cordyceps sp. RAO-2017]